MIDLHCHILPGLDDGPSTLDEAVEMCRIASKDGITTIVATPHFRPGRYEYPYKVFLEALTSLRSAISQANIDLSILPGADVTITPELGAHLSAQPHLTINGGGRYFLAEFPHDGVPPRWDQFLIGIMAKGLIPIITHPERNGWFLSRPGALEPIVLAGGLVQITADSVIGANGEVLRACAATLMERGLAHIIATDAHSSRMRRPILSTAVDAAAAIVGRERAERMVNDVPRLVIEGRMNVDSHPPVPAARKRTWFQRMVRL